MYLPTPRIQSFVALVAAVALSAALLPASAQETKVFDEEALLETGPLDDMVVGEDAAPVTIIEYASMTCPHCAHFHENVYPEVKEAYIETGKARLIFREFPLDRLAAAASMLARCVEPDRFFPFVGVLFEKQKDWVTESPIEPLKNLAKQAGLNDETFDKCLSNQELLDGIVWVRDRGDQEFDVNGTPSFFVNGEFVSAADVRDFDAMAEVIEKHLGE